MRGKLPLFGISSPLYTGEDLPRSPRIRIPRVILALLATSVLIATPANALPIGKISFIDGGVSILRNGKEISLRLITEGFGIEDQDVVKTGANTRLEITIDPSTGISAQLRLSPSTVFALEISALRNPQRGSLVLMAGAVAVKVAKMFGFSGFWVKTPLVTLGVRGTDFSVYRAPGGDILLLTREGRVVCENGFDSVTSTAGTLVEVNGHDRSLRMRSVGVDQLEDYRVDWSRERSEAFRADAPRAFEFFSELFDEHYQVLAQEMADRSLEASGILKLWADQDLQGLSSPLTDLVREKVVVAPDLFRESRALSVLEPYRYQLEDLRSVAPATPEVRNFFQQYDERCLRIDAWTADIRYGIKMYLDRNEGEALHE